MVQFSSVVDSQLPVASLLIENVTAVLEGRLADKWQDCGN